MNHSYDNTLRLEILNNSLDFELALSVALSDILNIDYDRSKSFGFSNQALSFSQKVALLLDMKSINNDDQIKLRAFMEIRNKFMHVRKCTSFKEYHNINKDTFNKLEKIYKPIPNHPLEDRFKFCFNKLKEDCSDIIVNKAFEFASNKKIEQSGIKRLEDECKSLKSRISLVIKNLKNNEILSNSNLNNEQIFQLQKEIFIQLGPLPINHSSD